MIGESIDKPQPNVNTRSPGEDQRLPYAEGGVHEVAHSLLRRDIHSLFDRGYVTVTPDLRFVRALVI
jgi:hypothetical protein